MNKDIDKLTTTELIELYKNIKNHIETLESMKIEESEEDEWVWKIHGRRH